MHAVAFGLLASLIVCPLLFVHKMTLLKACFGAFLFSSLYGFSDEVHQYFIPARQADIYDWMADTAGAMSVFSLILLQKIRTLWGDE